MQFNGLPPGKLNKKCKKKKNHVVQMMVLMGNLYIVIFKNFPSL